jgi:hypothetical protein
VCGALLWGYPDEKISSGMQIVRDWLLLWQVRSGLFSGAKFFGIVQLAFRFQCIGMFQSGAR